MPWAGTSPSTPGRRAGRRTRPAGSPTGGADPKAARRAGEVAAMRADEAYADLAPIVTGLRAEGLSLRQIAGRLNAEGHTTRRGKPWNATQVQRTLGQVGPVRAGV